MEEITYFFSYSRKDAEFALKLAGSLRVKNVSLWIDQLDIHPGDIEGLVIEKALQTCPGMIAIMSPDFVDSPSAMDEIAYAVKGGKRILPVLLRVCEIPYRLERLQYADFTTDYNTGLSQLLRELGVEQPSMSSSTSKGSKRELPILSWLQRTMFGAALGFFSSFIIALISGSADGPSQMLYMLMIVGALFGALWRKF